MTAARVATDKLTAASSTWQYEADDHDAATPSTTDQRWTSDSDRPWQSRQNMLVV